MCSKRNQAGKRRDVLDCSDPKISNLSLTHTLELYSYLFQFFRSVFPQKFFHGLKNNLFSLVKKTVLIFA